MTDRSIADQELFLPQEGQKHTQNQSQNAPPAQPRYYENLNNTAAPDDTQSAEHNPVPTFNVIGPTPSTSRSSTVRTNASHPVGQHAMAGALPEVTEEDNLYDAPNQASNYAPPPQQSSYQSSPPVPSTTHEPAYKSPEAPSQAPPPPPPPVDHSSPPAPSATEPWAAAPHHGEHRDFAGSSTQAWASDPHSAALHGAQHPSTMHNEPWNQTSSVGPSAAPAASYGEQQSSATHPGSWNQPTVPGPSSAPEPPPHPPTYDEYRASRADEVPPPLPGPRPPIPSSGLHEDVASSSAHPAMHLESDQVSHTPL